jgi:hypothetical protein
MAISMAKKREDIPYAILEMRDKFKKDRESLWELLDDAKQRSGADPLMAHKIFKNIEGKISRIMQEFSCGYNVKKDLFSVINAGLYLFNLKSGGLFSPSEAFSTIQQFGSMMQSYPVPSLLESLQNIEWDSTMRHFSEAEILCLRKSLGY